MHNGERVPEPARVTIRDVAERAGVSASTVSNLLNGRDERMLPSTRNRILGAISALGYRPNLIARQLRTGRARTIGLVVPSVANPFWGSFALAVEREALQHDYRLLLCNSERDEERERAYVDELWSDGVRAVIIGSSLPSLGHLQEAIDHGMLVLAFDRERQADDPPDLVAVGVDSRLGSRMATQHLLALGHRRIGFISGTIATVSRRQRLAGYREALADAGVEFRDELVWANGGEEGFGDVDSSRLGEVGMRALLRLDEAPTAVLTINDMYAMGACVAVRERGLRVPQDVSVVGFDDIVLASLVDPPLTTVRQPLDDMARYAIGIVGGDSERPHTEPRASVVMSPRLIVRSSTSAVNEHANLAR